MNVIVLLSALSQVCDDRLWTCVCVMVEFFV